MIVYSERVSLETGWAATDWSIECEASGGCVRRRTVIARRQHRRIGPAVRLLLIDRDRRPTANRRDETTRRARSAHLRRGRPGATAGQRPQARHGDWSAMTEAPRSGDRRRCRGKERCDSLRFYAGRVQR